MPLPPFTSEGTSAAKARIANRNKKNEWAVVWNTADADVMVRAFYRAGGINRQTLYVRHDTTPYVRALPEEALVLHDRGKRLRIERGSAHQRAINFFL